MARCLVQDYAPSTMLATRGTGSPTSIQSDVDEINPVLWNGNAVFIAKEFGHNNIAQYLLTKGGTVVVRNCHTIDTHEMKWSIGRGDCFFYKACKLERPGAGVIDSAYVPEYE
mmetsp:Transcript_55817/g.115235  ORF Transcript_55817/g.115235 Transcript_55817/m.115235 type:complete len:113 (+) Transcript_55817:326-664(+)